MIVCKFGGSSVASINGAEKIKEITYQNKNRKIIVVSALGKCEEHDYKITDRLFELYYLIQNGLPYIDILNSIFFRYEELSIKLNIKINWNKYKAILLNKIKCGIFTKEYIVSRGEYYSALLYSKYLNYKFLDARKYLIFNKKRQINYKKTKKMLNKLNLVENYVIGGYYGAKTNGDICVFDRGGSDITGAIICKLLNFEIYENYTDVSGIFNKNPNVFIGAKQQLILSFKTAIQMAEAGNEIVHVDALTEMKNSNSILLLKDTKWPNKFGSMLIDGEINNNFLNICVQKCTIFICKVANNKLISKMKALAEIKTIFLFSNKYYFILKNIYCDKEKFAEQMGGGHLFDGCVFTIFSHIKMDKKIIKKLIKMGKIFKKYNIFYNFSAFLNNFIIICNNFEYELSKNIINQYLHSC